VKIVFDTNVLARSHPGASGPARKALLHTLSSQHKLVASDYLLRELERVLQYPRILRRLPLTVAGITDYLEDLAKAAIIVAPAHVPPRLLRDSADEPILGTALAGNADILCSRDADFWETRVLAFCAEHGIRILSDLELLASLDFLDA